MNARKAFLSVLLAVLVAGVSTAVSAEETFYKGRGALYARGDGGAYLNIRYGAAVMDLTDSVVVVHDYGSGRVKVWAEGGSLKKIGNTWIFQGSGRLHTRGFSYFIAGLGGFEDMLALGGGWAVLDGDFKHLALGWNVKPFEELDERERVDEVSSVLSSVRAGALAVDGGIDDMLSSIVAAEPDDDGSEGERPKPKLVKNKVQRLLPGRFLALNNQSLPPGLAKKVGG
jgi:hypothetical protein